MESNIKQDESVKAYSSTDALRSALVKIEAWAGDRSHLNDVFAIIAGEAHAALSGSTDNDRHHSENDNDLANRVRAHVERLANTDMQLPLDEWCGISNDILRCADAMASGLPSISASPAPSTEGLREALAGLELFFAREGEGSVDHFERVADIFYRETGYLRPGKDCRLHDPEVRSAAWDKWVAEKLAKARTALAGVTAPSEVDAK